jgi:glycerate kinase
MKIVIAPDSFKECLGAAEVASAVGKGVLEACPGAAVDLCPMADGGDGTVEAMVAATGGRMMSADVFDPLGRPIRAHFGLLGQAAPHLPGEVGLAAAVAGSDAPVAENGGEDRVAVVEMAAASGLALVPPDKRNPLRMTTFGTGQLILAALDAAARRIIVGLGGSATVDGGCGCAQAMGVVFRGRDGQPLVAGVGGGALIDIEDMDISARDRRIEQADIRAACDVINLLTGPEGAAAVFGPQKGATAEMVARLEAGLSHLADLIRRRLGLDVEKLPGAGAAGGLGAGLAAFAGAKLQRGATIVAEAVGLHRRLSGADLCITGEGRLDGQSRRGKTAFAVAELAGEVGVPVICIPGQAAVDAPTEVFAAVRPLVAGQITPREAMRRPRELLCIRAAAAVKEFMRTR